MVRMFPQCFQVSHTGNTVSSVSFCFQDANYAYATRQGILTKIRACEHLQKFCEHKQASTRLLNFCEQFEQRPNLASTSNCMGPVDNLNTLPFVILLSLNTACSVRTVY